MLMNKPAPDVSMDCPRCCSRSGGSKDATIGVKDQLLLPLLDRIRQRDELAMGAFYEQTHRLLRIYVGRRIRDFGAVEEVLQDEYWQVWLDVIDYQPERGQPLNWLYMIARSRTFDALRRRQRKRIVPTIDDFTTETVATQRI
jgi:DNA-directed RNA polymerase specialized sigma24 family protein